MNLTTEPAVVAGRKESLTLCKANLGPLLDQHATDDRGRVTDHPQRADQFEPLTLVYIRQPVPLKDD